MEIDHHRVGLFAERTGGQLALARLERIVELGMHEHPAHDVGDQHARAVLGDIDAGAAPWRALWKIRGPEKPLLARREGKRLALVPDMIAGGHHVGACGDRLAENLFGDAEAAGGVLAIDDDEIQPEIGDQPGQLLPHRRTARLAHHVAEEKKSHETLLQGCSEIMQVEARHTRLNPTATRACSTVELR